MRIRFLVLLTAVVGLLTFYVGYRFVGPDGHVIFERENCVKCHVLRGHGFGVIDLSNVTSYRSRKWIRDHIRNPRQHNPTIGMPSFGHLSDREIEAIIDHLEGKGSSDSL